MKRAGGKAFQKGSIVSSFTLVTNQYYCEVAICSKIIKSFKWFLFFFKH